MHELSICLSMLQQVEEIAKTHNASRVTRICIQVGALSGVNPDLLAHAYPFARADTVAAAAELIIEKIPVRVICTVCGAETETAPNCLVCGSCGDWRTKLKTGDELLLRTIELQSASVASIPKIPT